MRKMYFFLVVLFMANAGWGQTTYTWNQTGTASWALSTNWTPTRTTPAIDDILVFNNGATTTVTAVPTQTIGQLLVSASTTVNLQGAAAGTTLTIGGGTGTDLSVASGSALNMDVATNTTTILVATGATGSITGNMTFTTAAHKLNAADASGITFNSPAVFTQGTGCTGNVFTAAGTADAIVFATGTTFVQSAGANPFGLGQPASKVVFQTGSLFRNIGASLTPSFSGRTYANIEFAGSGTSSMTGTAAFTCDNLTITSGTANINMTTAIGHSIKGNISVAGGATLTFTPALAGTMNFNGTSAQSISNSGTLTFATNASVTINNSSGVTLNTPVTLGTAATLTLTSGLLTIGTNNLVISNTISGGSATAYVRTNGTGTLTINNIAVPAKTFHIGNSTYNPLIIANGSTHNWTTRVEDAVLNVLPPYNTSKAVLRTWHITPSVNPPAGGADLTFQYDDGDPTQIGASFITSEDVQLWHYGVAWIAASGAITPTGGPGGIRTITKTGWSQYSRFAIANITGPLPVTFSSFSGYKDGSRNQLRWTTATEVDNLGFDVQRSTDGINYVSIGFVNSLALNGNSSDLISYTFTDNAPAGNRQYYRLRQQDLNGQGKLSNIVLIKGAKPAVLTIESIFPNPAKNTINVIVSTPVKDNITVMITDMAGRLVSRKAVNAETGSNTVPVDISHLQSGNYIVRVACSEGCEMATAKFVKQ